MREVGTLEVRNSLSALIKLAEKGNEVTITRHGKPVARLVPVAGGDVGRAREAAEVLRVIRAQARPGPECLKELVTLGRRY